MTLKVKTLAAILIVFVCVVFIARQGSAFDLFGHACVNDSANSSTCKQAKDQGNKDPIAGPGGLISKASNVIAVVGGIVAVIMIIISGFWFVTAGGSPIGQGATDANQIKRARATLLGALIGAVVIALAWTITRFVTDRVIQ